MEFVICLLFSEVSVDLHKYLTRVLTMYVPCVIIYKKIACVYSCYKVPSL